MAIADAIVAHAVSVWVVHSVRDPVLLFKEVARVLRPGGSYILCTTQEPTPDDRVGQVLAEMGARVDARRGAPRQRGVTSGEALLWASQAGFVGQAHRLERQWRASPKDELAAIALRQWPALRQLDEEAIEEVTRPAVEALEAMPATEVTRRGDRRGTGPPSALIVSRRGSRSAHKKQRGLWNSGLCQALRAKVKAGLTVREPKRSLVRAMIRW